MFRSFKEDFCEVIAGELALRLQEWRSHMAIGYRTAAEAWDGGQIITGHDVRISLWNGALRASFFPHRTERGHRCT